MAGLQRKRLLLVSHSSADIAQVLKIYHANKDSNVVSIFVSSHAQQIDIFRKFGVKESKIIFGNLELKFGGRGLYILSDIFKLRHRVNQLLADRKLLNFDKIIFFSKFGDVGFYMLIGKLKKSTNLQFDDIFNVDKEPLSTWSLLFNGKIKFLLIWYILRILSPRTLEPVGTVNNPQFQLFGHHFSPVCDNYASSNQPPLVKKIDISSSTRIDGNSKKAIVLFNGNYPTLSFNQEKKTVTKIIRYLFLQGIHVFVKCHPDTKANAELAFQKLGVEIIDSTLPFELLDTGSVDVLIGLTSQAMCENTKLKVVSYLELIQSNQHFEEFAIYKQQLKNNKNIIFISCIEDLGKII